jgi:serine protease Do
VVLDFDGKPIDSPKDLSRAVAQTESGASVPVKIWRNDSEQTVTVKIAEMKEDVASAETGKGSNNSPAASDTVEQLGATLAPVTDETRQQYGLADNAEGVVVADLDQDSALADQGVRPGDVIERVNDHKVTSPNDVAKALKEARADKRSVAVMLIARDGNDHFVAVQIDQS